MSRTSVSLRDAEMADAPFLVELWNDSVRPGEFGDQVVDLEQVIARVDAAPGERLFVAEFGGNWAGAVLVELTTVSPLDLDPVVRVYSPQVLPAYQRKGVGHALMDAALTFAEEHGIERVAATASSHSRNGNRYLARLGFGQLGIYRTAATAIVRAAHAAQRPHRARHRPQLGQVLAARRSMRRDQPVG